MVEANDVPALKAFVGRQMSDDSRNLLENADVIARELLYLVMEQGLAHDWDNEPDIRIIEPPPAGDLSREPLLGLDSRYTGRWSVSHVLSFLDHTSVLTSSPFSSWRSSEKEETAVLFSTSNTTLRVA